MNYRDYILSSLCCLSLQFWRCQGSCVPLTQPKVVGPSVSEQIRKSDSVQLADCQGGGSRGQKKEVGVTYSAYPIVINLMQLIAYKG